jgi:hypothetical protein
MGRPNFRFGAVWPLRDAVTERPLFAHWVVHCVVFARQCPPTGHPRKASDRALTLEVRLPRTDEPAALVISHKWIITGYAEPAGTPRPDHETPRVGRGKPDL